MTKVKLKVRGRQATPSRTEVSEEDKIERSKRGKRSKNKGASYERTIAKKFCKAYGIELTRTPQSGGFAKKSEKADDFRGDIVVLDPELDFKVHIECKNHKSWSLPSWIKQAESDCPEGKEPIVIFHKDGTSKDYACISLEALFKLVPKEMLFVRKVK